MAFPLYTWGLGLADHLDVAHRVLEALHAKVKVVQSQCLLELGRVGFFRDSQHCHAVVEHIVAPDLVGAIGQPTRMLIIGGREQEPGRVGRSSGDDDDAALVGFWLSPLCSTTTSVTDVPVAWC